MERTIFPDSLNPGTGVDRCFNLISLSVETHAMWNKGMFALKPLQLSSDRKTLTIQLFWPVPSKYEIDSQIDLLTEPMSSKGVNLHKEHVETQCLRPTGCPGNSVSACCISLLNCVYIKTSPDDSTPRTFGLPTMERTERECAGRHRARPKAATDHEGRCN